MMPNEIDDVTRLMFVGNGREAESIIALSFDRFLSPTPIHTYIYQGPHNLNYDLLEKYKEFGINVNNITIISDAKLIYEYNVSEDFYKFGGWISQQLLKLMALDQCNHNKILIQDCDIIPIKLYKFFENGAPVLLKKDINNEIKSNNYTSKLLGISSQTNDCFITEFMPILKTDWISFKEQIEKIHNINWISAIIKVFNNDIDHAKSYLNQIQFSEYEILSNWILYNNPIITVNTQKKLTIFNNVINKNIIAYDAIHSKHQLTFNEVGSIINFIEKNI